ncbi:mucin-4-like [Biomphalaria glabrata]|uniref:Mucin-4-like n=1 Tax=Biomphalaria glabrata TaxID=6526 RepID=A0A9U8DXN3_BIOGL|nr:mucin-4-like [Biomphalaria glabrata]
MLKRKLEETAGEGEGTETTSNGQSESDDSNCSAGSTDALAPEASGPSPPKRMKKKVNFKGVTVYYFPRRQGFTCVPSEGGSTLGMSERHTFTKDFSLSDYTKEQKRIHRAILAEQRRQGKMFPSPLLASSVHTQDDEDISSGSESDSEYDDYYFLQPLPIRQRRVLLRTAGVKKIDNEEKDECRDIRVSRNVCGCDCKVFCDPATCSCSLAGIQCQVDRLSFPCGCTKDGCTNPAGRIEFNPIRVRTHFIHTLMRLELERKDSESPESTSSAATTSFLQSSSANVDIDVVGANGEEVDVVVENPEFTNNDSCSGASTDSSSSNGKLKSKLKQKKAESIDLNLFNSNEKGSCRDCQNTDMCNVMMHDVKFSMATQQRQQQQQRAISITLGTPPGYQGAGSQQQIQQHHHLGLSPGISLLHSSSQPQAPQQQPSSGTHMLLFNDGEDDVYQAENTTSMYFDNDDSSYSELSDTSHEGLEPRSFSLLSQNNFSSGKFHLPPSQIFSHMGGASNPKTQSVMSGTNNVITQPGLHPISTSCSLGVDHHQPCSLMAQSTTTVHAGQSLLRAPYQQPMCSVPPSSTVLHPRPQLASSLGIDMSDSSHLLQGNLPRFPNKFSHSEELDTTLHLTTPSFKLDTPLISAHSYGSDAVPAADYLPSANISTPSTGSFGNLSPAVPIIPNTTSFDTLQGGPCWTTSLVSSSLRECYGPSLPSTSNSGLEQDSPCKSNFHHDLESCALSPTTTYATMTTTTRDLLAAHCPGISSHMDSKSEHATNSSIKDSEPYTNFHLPSQSSTTGDILYTSPYSDRRILDSGSGTITSTAELESKACNLSEELFTTACVDSTSHTSKLTSSDVSSSDVTSSMLPLSTSYILSLQPAVCSSSSDSTDSKCSTVAQQGSEDTSVFYDCQTSSVLGVSDTHASLDSNIAPSDFSPQRLQCSHVDAPWDSQDSSLEKMSVDILCEGSEAAVSSSSAPSSSSASPTTSDEDKDTNVRPSFGEIMKESLVEMVLV